MIPRPQTDEYAPFYAGYVGRVPEGSDIFALLRGQPDDMRALLGGLTDEQANTAFAPGEWSVKEVMGHICDAERIFAYRALRIARGDTTPLAGFEQDAYVKGTNFNARRLDDLLEEFACHRRANLLCFQPLTGEEIARRGTSGGNPISARALLYIMAGHVLHHVESFRTDYKVGG
jgi:hypothetical protein